MHFRKQVMKTFIGILATWLALTLPAGAQEFEEDVNYFPLMVAQPVSTGDKIEVLELFFGTAARIAMRWSLI